MRRLNLKINIQFIILALIFLDYINLPARPSPQDSQKISSIQNHLYQGEKYLEKGDYRQAEEQFVLAIRLMPQGPTAQLARVKIGFIYYRQNRYELARKELNAVLQAAPDNREAKEYLQWIQWMLNGENAFSSNQYQQASEHYQRVLQVDSTNQFAKQQFAHSQDRANALNYVQKFNEALASGQISAAETYLNQVERFWKDYPDIAQLHQILANLKSGMATSEKKEPGESRPTKKTEEAQKNDTIRTIFNAKNLVDDTISTDSVKKTGSAPDSTGLIRPASAFNIGDYSLYFLVFFILILSVVILYFRRRIQLKSESQSPRFENDLAVNTTAPQVQKAAPAPAEPTNSSFIGKYEIIAELEHGGMGRVVKARHPHFRQPVVIKSLLPEFTNHPVFRQRLVREANILFELDHPNIVRVTDLLEEKEQVFIVMQYVDGKNLYQYVQENGPLKIEKALPLFSQACLALGYLHEHQIIHRDIKPQNMMLLRHEEKIKLVDFGIVKPMTTDYGEALTSASRIAGTPNFMSPEQLLNDEIDPRTDIFSLGISLFFVLTGKHPFDGYGISIMRAILEKEPQKLTGVHSDFSPAVEELCSRMMARDREDRFQSILEVRNALMNISAHDNPGPKS